MAAQQLPQPFGKYILLNKIALGGMAEIFRAKTIGAEGFEKEVVIKRILPHFTEDEAFVTMFIDEAKVTSGLNHPNIVQIFDFDIMDETYYIAMEYVEGKDLKRVMDNGVKEGRPLTVPQIVKIIIETCNGLHYAHTKKHRGQPLNIIHRDVSPHNVMVSFEGDVKVMDFGIAKAAARSTKTRAGTVKGKCAYMSPEQARGKNLDPRSDMFAVGVMMWEMLTHRRLFAGDSDFETLSNVLKAEVPPPSSINPDVPAEIDAILLRCLSKDREERQKDCRDLSRELQGWMFSHIEDQDAADLTGLMKEMFTDDIQALREMQQADAKTNFFEVSEMVRSGRGGSSSSIQRRPSTSSNIAAEAVSSNEAKTMAINVADAQAMMNADRTLAVDPSATGLQGEGERKKSRAGLWIFLLLLMVGAGGGGFWWWQQQQAADAAKKTTETAQNTTGDAATTTGTAANTTGDGNATNTGDTGQSSANATGSETTAGGTGEATGNGTVEADTGDASAAGTTGEATAAETTGEPATTGETTGGETAGAETTGEEPTTGAETGGETNGGETNGGETTAGETTGSQVPVAPKKSTVTIVALPTDAIIKVNGEQKGTGKATFEADFDSVLQIEVSHPDYITQQKLLKVSQDSVTEPMQLAKKPVETPPVSAFAKVTFNVSPSDAKVMVNGQVLPAQSPGVFVVEAFKVGDDIEVVVTAKNHTPKSDKMKILTSELTRTIALKKKTVEPSGPGTAYFKAKPWANVFVKGDTCQTNCKMTLASGRYTATFKQGGVTKKKGFRIRPGKNVTVFVDMTN